MRIVPVIDLRNGVAVHAQGGRRAHYEPIVGRLHGPSGLARRLLEITGGDELYLADLDAIEGRPPNRAIWRTLAESGTRTWLDAGIRSVNDADAIDAETIVAGLETLEGPEALKGLVDRVGSERVVFSIDLRAGAPIVAAPGLWAAEDPVGLAETAIGLGCTRILRLDLARVGTGSGTGAAPWLRRVRDLAGERVELAVGGGVSSVQDLESLEEAGASAVLVATALRDGRLDRDSIARWRGRFPGGLRERVADVAIELPLADDQQQVEQAGEEERR